MTTGASYSDMADMLVEPEIAANPDILATDLDLSARVALRTMIVGRQNETINSLQDIQSSGDFVNARSILNPGDTEHAQTYADVANGYLAIFNNSCAPVQMATGESC